MSNINQDFRYDTDQVRRYAHHMQHGGKLKQRDIDNCVAIVEKKDSKIDRLLTEIEILKKQLSDASWASSPDTSGGGFTQEEIDRGKTW